MTDAYWKTTCIGYCELSLQQINNHAQSENFNALSDVRGEYVLVFERNDECVIVTSPVGAMHYFYLLKDHEFYHGDQVLDIAARAKIPWTWNWQALGDLCHLENLTDNTTLHAEIKRVPPGSILRYGNGKLTLHSVAYIDTIRHEAPNPDGAVSALNDEVATWAGSEPYLSLSGGFDSRVILSSLLKQGIKPHLITMGNDQSSDVRVAREIGRTFSLEHDLIRINLDDFLKHAYDISSITNGTKTAWHWHTYLYPLKANIKPESTFFVGTLGEFARSYYFDKGRIGDLAGLLPDLSLHNFWSLKINRHPTFLQSEHEGLSSNFSKQLNHSGSNERISRLVNFCHHQFLPGLTRYYFEQRVPNFYANGIKMYLASSKWKSPFHSRKWINHIWNLDSSWKLGSNWHRYAIKKNLPKLLQFPEENGFSKSRILAKAPPLYWSSIMRRNTYVSYDLSANWYRTSVLHDFINDSLSDVEDIIEKKTAQSILKMHSSGIDRTRSLAFLITMICWKRNISKQLS